MEYRLFTPGDLDAVIALTQAEGWPSFGEDPARAQRALTAPGVTTIVAVDGGRLVGFAQLQSDGEIQAHLTLIAVAADARREGVGRAMLELALEKAGGLRIDLLTEEGDDFYASFEHHRRATAFRLYPPFRKR